MDIRRYNATYFKHKIYDSSLRKAIRSSIDLKRIQKEFPHLQGYFEKNKSRYTSALLPFYEQYISRVSNEIMAISLELSVFLIILCDMTRPQKILDLGSGFSSFTFRFMNSILEGDYFPVVWSVDDSLEWLHKTDEFLVSNNITTNYLMTWDSFVETNLGLFDLILYDIGEFRFRKEVLDQIITFSDVGGMMLIDDMHSAELGRFVGKTLKKRDCNYYDISYYTKDKLGRYSLLVSF